MLFGDWLLFAQQRGGGGDPTAQIIGGCVQCGVLIAEIAYAVWFFMTTYKALDAVSPRNRDMEPGQVFLALIPLFNIVWIFFIIFRIASSMEKEFRSRGLRRDGDMGATIGMWGMISNLLCCAPVGIVLNIMWLVKISGYTKQLQESRGRGRSDDDDDDDDDDDRPRRRRRRDDDDD